MQYGCDVIAKWGENTRMQIVRCFLSSLPCVYNLSEAKDWGKFRTVVIKAEKTVGIEVSIFNSIQTITIFN